MSKLTNNALGSLVENYAKKLHEEIHLPNLHRETAPMQEYQKLTEEWMKAKEILDEVAEKRAKFKQELGITHYSFDPVIVIREYGDIQKDPRGWSVNKLKEKIFSYVALGSVHKATDLYNDLKKAINI